MSIKINSIIPLISNIDKSTFNVDYSKSWELDISENKLVNINYAVRIICNDKVVIFNPFSLKFHISKEVTYDPFASCISCSLYKYKCTICDNMGIINKKLKYEVNYFRYLGQSLYIKSLFVKNNSEFLFL